MILLRTRAECASHYNEIHISNVKGSRAKSFGKHKETLFDLSVGSRSRRCIVGPKIPFFRLLCECCHLGLGGHRIESNHPSPAPPPNPTTTAWEIRTTGSVRWWVRVVAAKRGAARGAFDAARGTVVGDRVDFETVPSSSWCRKSRTCPSSNRVPACQFRCRKRTTTTTLCDDADTRASTESVDPDETVAGAPPAELGMLSNR